MDKAYALTANDGTGRVHDGYYNKGIARKIDEINTKSWQADRKVVSSKYSNWIRAGILGALTWTVSGGPIAGFLLEQVVQCLTIV
ncbi:hypothetical protein JYK00_06400 [Thermosipho ferrireducens]|uniref:Uncharacterized protein n=1 Tax=Thermosipho ferrireducens TaxID=2571116 RepID=A0ABX7S4J3_9BACT|nr:hypothetical protein [Thermosipho ferrireducens]QTA37369.1 hypothetical protein JYK00_06400 [Thermosipho ferrireducens]